MLRINKKQSFQRTWKGHGLETTKISKKPGSIVPTLQNNQQTKFEQLTDSIGRSFGGRNEYTIFSLSFDCIFVSRFPPHFLRLPCLLFVFKIITLLAKLCTCSVTSLAPQLILLFPSPSLTLPFDFYLILKFFSPHLYAHHSKQSQSPIDNNLIRLITRLSASH